MSDQFKYNSQFYMFIEDDLSIYSITSLQMKETVEIKSELEISLKQIKSELKVILNQIKRPNKTILAKLIISPCVIVAKIKIPVLVDYKFEKEKENLELFLQKKLNLKNRLKKRINLKKEVEVNVEVEKIKIIVEFPLPRIPARLEYELKLEKFYQLEKREKRRFGNKLDRRNRFRSKVRKYRSIFRSRCRKKT